MDDTSNQVLAAIIELAVCKDSKEIKTPWAGLRLRSALKEKEDQLLSDVLDGLQQDTLIKWHKEEANVAITVSDKQEIPHVSADERETVCDRALRRSLIYRLYEEYRKAGNKHVHYPLAQLGEILEVSKEEIYTHVMYLKNEYYLEYKVMDGGMCTSDITHYGIKLCELKSTLFKEFSTVQIMSKDKTKEEKSLASDPKKVFVVHGRNEKARSAMFSFLRSIGLHPIEWSEAISYTKTGSPYVGDILEHAFKVAQAVVVLITGDDIAKLSAQYVKANDPEFEKKFTPQARPNVIFEAGLALGSQPQRTIIVELGKNRPFSDIAGRHILQINSEPKARHALVSRLKTAGCNIDIENKSDWLHEGDFDGALQNANEIVIESHRQVKIGSNAEIKDADVSDVEKSIMKLMAVLDDTGYPIEYIAEKLKMSKTKMQYYLEKLEETEYIYTSRSSESTEYYLDTKGRAFLVENNLI